MNIYIYLNWGCSAVGRASDLHSEGHRFDPVPSPPILKEHQMKVEIDKETNEVVIRLPIEKEPKDSASGKTKIIASSSGRNITTESYNGKQLMVTASVYYKP